ncbi:MAG: hypothetical protein DKM50_11605 [Candidatus Margulisiibacteriota bacterium]|nr:MAG: hypothetical protein A2X43_02330 [Candidatus Margulisbacteria bacterium GWD2_39_127]OGI01195.1 MAG: hypothetical protein A2X42_06155 [Candidatus Margulisbacteria bacterium GWF2_38_17]OGI09830.1 MAG: hypothetical protein A2X41_09875 [Candidatus Margulisbacteria bacterium GWE2_39_32]PZM78419.1 MAG: hypothetical protein DKM50_11605 [Candidatus Margulisiibacteriota bacterium]HAR62391.1 hypothetical protein [Candidatus Margulisiibacteriota bacterium]
MRSFIKITLIINVLALWLLSCAVSAATDVKKNVQIAESPVVANDLQVEVKEDPTLSNMPKIIGITDKIVNCQLVNDEDIDYLDSLYRRGQAKEQHSIYTTAISNYQDLLKYAFDLLSKNKKISENKMHSIMPYVISASYRIGIVTNKSIKGNMLNLYDQLEMYKSANDMINQSISLIADYKYEKRIRISKSLYGMLYYARGYNKIALAKALLAGNIWKKYTIYPPSDIIALITSGVNDIGIMLEFCSLTKDSLLMVNGLSASVNTNAEWESLVDNYLVKYLLFINTINYELKTIQLSYYTADKNYIKEVVKKRVVNSVYPLLDYYNSKNVQNVLNSSKNINSIDDITLISPELFNVVNKIFDITQNI